MTLLSVGSLSFLCSVFFRSVLGAVTASYAFVVILNLTCLALFAAQLPITRQTPGSADVPASLASGAGAMPADGEARRWRAY